MPKQKKKNIKKIVVILLACIAAITLLLIILEKIHVTHFVTGKQAPASAPTTPFDTATNSQKQQDATTNASNKQQAVDKGVAPSITTPSENTNQSIDLSAKQESNGTITVFTKLYGYSSGSCDLTVTNGSQSKNQTANIIYAPEYASCAGFSVPVNGLGTGDWTISLTISSGGKTTTKSLTFKVT